MTAPRPTITPVCENAKARYDYDIVTEYEAGIILHGHEVKSLRAKTCNLRGSYVVIHGSAVILRNCHLSPYGSMGNKDAVDPVRERILLLHRRDRTYLESKSREGGFAIFPVSIYFSGNLAKVKIALGRGRKAYQKKQLLKERDISRDAERTIRNRDW